MKIYCCCCAEDVTPRLTDGSEIYPHRPDLAGLPFWRCDGCCNFVGCHHKTRQRTRPLGCIPTPAIREARRSIHAELDPLWKENGMNRKKLYASISDRLGYEYHTANVRSVEEAERVLGIILEVSGR